MRRLRSALRGRLLGLALLGALPAFALVVYFNVHARREAVAGAFDDVTRLARVAVSQQERLTASAQHLLIGLSRLPEIRQLDPVRCTATMTDVVPQLPSYVNIGVARPDGSIACSALPIQGVLDFRDREWFQRSVRTGQMTVTGIPHPRVTKRPAVMVTLPVTNERGETQAVLFAGIRLDWIGDFATAANLPAGSTVWIMDGRGQVVARYPADGATTPAEAPHTFLAPPLGTTATTEELGADGVRRLCALAPLAAAENGGAVYVGIGVPRAGALASAQTELLRHLGFVTLAALLTVGLAWRGTTVLVLGAVRTLTAATRRLGAGDLGARAAVAAKYGELSELARAFNDMASALQERDAAIAVAAAHRRAMETRLQWAAIVENSSDAILGVGDDGVIFSWNAGAEALYGYPAAEAIGRSLEVLVPEDRRDESRRLFERVRRGETLLDFETVRLRKSGETFDASLTLSLIRDPAGRVHGVSAITHDITERKRAQEARHQLQTQLAQAEKLAAMSNLLAGVAHELNNPLSVVIGHTAILSQLAAGTPAEPRARKIGEAAQRCARIVKNFLSLARKHAPERQAVALSALVRETLEMMAYQLRVDDIEVVLDLADDVPPLFADPYQLQQVLVNLVSNAHHAMRRAPGPRRLTVASRLSPDARRVTLTVADTGPGIPPEVARHLFEPFFTTKGTGEGTGLGLVICRSVVEAHGGRLTVDPGPGRGATFVVELPREDVPAPAPVATNGPVPAVRARRILVVDDEPDVRDLLADILAADGHQVDAAANGHEALASLERATYDAILSDVRMPGLDGPALYRAVAGRRPELLRRFVFVTGDTLSQTTREFLEETKAPSLEKPFSVATTRAALAAVDASA